MEPIDYKLVRRSFVANIYTLANVLDLYFPKASGSALLGLQKGAVEWPALDEFDLAEIGLEDTLQEAHRYAYYSEISRRSLSDDEEEDSLGRLKAILEMASSNCVAGYFDSIYRLHRSHDGDEDHNEVHQMMELAFARYAVDFGDGPTIKELALLSDMDVQSVRNSLSQQGITLQGSDDWQYLNRSQALAWLRSRRGFRATRRVGSLGDVPSELAADEIMGFIRDRVAQASGLPWLGEKFGSRSEFEQRAREAIGKKIGWSLQQVDAMLAGTLEDISSEDLPLIARMMELDDDWFKAQVTRARHRQGTGGDDLATGQRKFAVAALDENKRTLTVELSDAGVRNGYIDFDLLDAKRFFPTDSFGTKGSQKQGKEVQLSTDMDSNPYLTDIRIKSRTSASPRKRFTSFFKAHQAKAGDMVVFTRTGERGYHLTYLG